MLDPGDLLPQPPWRGPPIPRGTVVREVTVPGGARWICRVCQLEIVGGERAIIKVGAKVYHARCFLGRKLRAERGGKR